MAADFAPKSHASPSSFRYSCLYLQVSQAVEKQISSGEFPPGSKLPGDVEISEKHGVSVITARAAMRVLIDKNRIVRYAGKGSFVLAEDQVPAEWRLGSLSDLVLIGKKSKFILLERRLCRRTVSEVGSRKIFSAARFEALSVPNRSRGAGRPVHRD